MALQSWVSKLKLIDDEPKGLGVSHLTAAEVVCHEGLKEGVDFSVDRERGTVTRLKVFGHDLYTFIAQYDDQAEQRQAEEEAERVDMDAARIAVAYLDAYIALASPTNAQSVAAIKLLCRIVIILIRRALRVTT